MKSRRALVVFGLAMLTGCPGNVRVRPWMIDGKQVGTIREIKASDGHLRQFIDTSDRIVRIERLAPDGSYTPVAPVTTLEWNGDRLTQRTHLTANGEPTVDDDGIGTTRFVYEGTGCHCTFHDAAGNVTERPDRVHRVVTPMCTGSGDHVDEAYDRAGELVMRRVYRYRGGQLFEVRYLDAANQQATGRFRGRPVRAIRYDRVRGVPKPFTNEVFRMVVEHIIGPDGATVASIDWNETPPMAFCQ